MPSPVGLGFKKQRLRTDRRKLKVVGELEAAKSETIDININTVYNLARNMHSIDEMAGILGIGLEPWRALVQTNWKLGDAIQRGHDDTRGNLRKTQLELALSGHPSMLMWLGKQYLGQADKVNTETKTEINITVQRAMEQLNGIPKEQLLAARAALRGSATTPVVDAEFSEADIQEDEGGPPV